MSGIPSVALINNAPTPYRVIFHQRLARQLPQYCFWSVFTHGVSNADWRLDLPREIRPVFFGTDESSLAADCGAAQPHEWEKAGRIIQWMKDRSIRAIVLGGYNDMGRLRILAWCRRNHIPCLLFGDSNIDCDRPAGLQKLVKRCLLPVVLRNFTSVLCCGTAGEAYFKRYGVSPDRLFRVPYEADYDALQQLAPDVIAETRDQFQLPDGRLYILYAGRLVGLKRVDLLIAAFSRVAERWPDWDLLIAGDGPERTVLENSVPPALRGRVRWVGFINAPRVLAGIYGCARVGVLASDYEPWGVALTEAACRMPVIASSVVGAALDVVRDGVNGRVFTAGDLESLVSCLNDVLSPSRLQEMTVAAPGVFMEWRRANDPVEGLRRALRQAEPTLV